MIAAGRLRHRIRIERAQRIRDQASGGWVNDWQPFAEGVPAEIAPLSVRDFIQSGSRQAEVTGRILIRFIPGFKNTDRIVDEVTGAIYAVVGILPDDKTGRGYLTIPVKEGVHDG